MKQQPLPSNDSNDLIEKPWSEEKLIEILSERAKNEIEVEKKLENLDEDFTLLFLTEPDKLHEIRISLLKLFAKKKLEIGIVVSSALPWEKLSKHLKQNKISFEQFTIIDASGSKGMQKNIVYLEDPSDLNELLSKIEENLEEMKKENCFILIDSVTTMLVYNDEKTVEKFFHSLVSKITLYKTKAVFLGIKTKEARNMLKAIGNFCDKIVDY